MNIESEYDKFLKYGPQYRGTNYTPAWVKKEDDAFDFLEKYAKVFNHFTASTPQPNPLSNKAMFIIDALNQAGVKYSIDIFEYNGFSLNWGFDSQHKLLNIIAEPNPNATGPATLFVAHHDVANVRSENAQDNGASVCHLLKLANLIKKSQDQSERIILLFSDCEEFGARGAERFAKNSKVNRNTGMVTHNIYGDIARVVNLELTGVGKVIWSDCGFNQPDNKLHTSLEQTFGKSIPKFKTPPSDVIAFRKYEFPALCIGILNEGDLTERNTWRLCHSMNDTVDKCSKEDMKDFTEFLFNLTKIVKAEPIQGELVTSPA